MNLRSIITICGSLAAIGAFIWLSKLSPIEAERTAGTPREDTVTTPNPTSVATPQPNPPSTTQSREERATEAVEVIERALATPITFSGKVVDQNGEHVGNAKVEFSMLDSFNSSGSNRETFADDNGHFMISEVKGAVLGVKCEQKGILSDPQCFQSEVRLRSRARRLHQASSNQGQSRCLCSTQNGEDRTADTSK